MLTATRARALAASLVPTFPAARKGAHGKILIVGGSLEYTGAPYFAAMSALRTGADLVWVATVESACTPIKTLAPDVIVLPCLGGGSGRALSADDATPGSLSSVFARVDACVIGPGLGRGESAWADARAVLDACRVARKPVVVDGDALFFAARDPSSVSGLATAVLTPNAGELARLCESVRVSDAASLAAALGVGIIAKGEVDQIFCGGAAATVDAPGAPRRCGGQGDVLAGALGTWLAWEAGGSGAAAADERRAAACWGAGAVTRSAAARAWAGGRRSMVSHDVLGFVGEAFQAVFPDNI